MVSTLQAQRGYAAALLVMCLAGFATWREITLPMRPLGEMNYESQIVSRYEPFLSDLPAHGEICYMSDIDRETPAGGEFYYVAQYTLAPLVLRPASDCEIAIGNYLNPANAAAAVEANRLQVVRSYGNGLMLLRKRQ